MRLDKMPLESRERIFLISKLKLYDSKKQPVDDHIE